MAYKRYILNSILTLLAIILMGTAAYLSWLPPLVYMPEGREETFGTFENRRLSKRMSASGQTIYAVEDSLGNFLFNIPLKKCLLDTRFRDGKLRFRDESTKKEGFIDSVGYITFIDEQPSDMIVASAPEPKQETADISLTKTPAATHIQEAKLEKMLENHPFRLEAAKVLSGKLEVGDSLRRRRILNYCEHFRMAYDTKDIDFLNQVFSDNALIVVGHTVRPAQSPASGISYSDKVEYSIHSKQSYLARLSKIFGSNKKIKVDFSDFQIMRHPTIDGIYGVSLRQKYRSDRYSDDGYLFLLWDFRNESMPKIHVRTWQPRQILRQGEEPIDIGDFNLE